MAILFWLTGSAFGGWKSRDSVPQLVDQYINKKIQLDEFVSHVMKFEQVNEGFELLHSGNWWVWYCITEHLFSYSCRSHKYLWWQVCCHNLLKLQIWLINTFLFLLVTSAWSLSFAPVINTSVKWLLVRTPQLQWIDWGYFWD